MYSAANDSLHWLRYRSGSGQEVCLEMFSQLPDVFGKTVVKTIMGTNYCYAEKCFCTHVMSLPKWEKEQGPE